MARDSDDATPLGGREALAAYLAGGEKPMADFRIGTEHEKFPFTLDGHRPVPYEGKGGIEALLRGMEGLLGWAPITDEGRIIGLSDPTGGGAISLEPGGQFELSGAPLENLHQTCSEVHAHLAQVRQIATPMGVGFVGLGMSPVWSLAETPVMPKSRYDIMKRYMPKVGMRGLDMMFRTATIQVNLDFSSEADMVAKMRVGLAFQPIATALFANAPFTDGKPNGLQSARAYAWLDTDNNRAGGLPQAFEPSFGYEAYVDWALDVPMYFIKRGNTYHDVAGSSFRDLMDGRHPAVPGERATLSDWTNHLSTLFPDVRLKRFLEMRGADGGPWARICALPAFWVGLLYDGETLAQAEALALDLTAEERHDLRESVPTLGLRVPYRGGTGQDLAAQLVALARQGLRNRARTNASGNDESIFLSALEEVVETGRSPADILLEHYHGAWGEDLDKLFEEFAY
ncbi:MAG: glutamate--cysteine ligase [Devosiaceae bacterium]|nr:glutamate--cysteine ligase [Devosiaceae bacterium MH13]